MNEPCPICQSQSIRDAGPVFHPRNSKVAGVPIDLTAMTFRLYECADCAFAFKRPLIPTEKLLACYANADTSNWSVDPDPIRRRFDNFLEVLRRHAAPESGRPLRVLDVGCFNGAMLKYFGDSFDRYGVEPGVRPAQLASERGVRMLGDTIENVRGYDGFFEVIFAVDVIEHINDPISFFEHVSKLLKPGSGVFVAITGDRDAPSFRLQGSLYWYVSNLPEHVAFWNKRSTAAAGERCSMRLIEHRRTSHHRDPPLDWYRQAAANIVFAILKRFRCFGIPAIKRIVENRSAPNFIASADHMICVLKRNA